LFDGDCDGISIIGFLIVNVEKPQREIKGLQLIFIELPKFKPSTRVEKKLQVLWFRFLSEIKEAIALSEQAAYSPAELATYNTYWDTVSTEKTLMTGKYREGKAEGIVEGRIEGKVWQRVDQRVKQKVERR